MAEYNVLIIEDEAATARRLQKLLIEIKPEIKVLGVLESIAQAVEWFANHQLPDLLFVDINLSDGLSFSIFEEVEVNCPIIFTTAYDQYAIDAFKVNSIDYLLKPINKESLAKSIIKFEKLTKPAKDIQIDYSKLAAAMGQPRADFLKRIVVRYGEVIKAIEIKDAAYFFSDEKLVFMTLKSGTSYPVDFTLDQLDARLDPSDFYRVNRKFIVSYSAIERMIAYSKSRVKITLNPACDLEVISSTERSGDFKEWLAGK